MRCNCPATAVQQHVPGAAELAHECVQALRDREWDGDEELAGHLEAVLGVAPTPLLRRLQVDLEMLSGVLEGDPLSGDGRVDLRSGEVWPPEVIEYAVESGELDEADADDPERWLWIHNRGSRAGYRDMVDFARSMTDSERADRLEIALQGRGAFRRFKDVLAGWPAELDRWVRVLRRTSARPGAGLARGGGLYRRRAVMLAGLRCGRRGRVGRARARSV